MNKISYKICVILSLAVLVFPAYPDDAPSVAERTNCAEINAEILSLSSVENPDSEQLADIEKMQAIYRRDCIKRAGGRIASGRGNVVRTMPETDAADAEKTDLDDADSNAPTDAPSAMPADDNSSPILSPAQVIANLESGLCADGTAPNRFGCCAGEIFKDIGDLVFACCAENGECFPPMK